METEQFAQLRDLLRETIEAKVNGKIDKLTILVNNQADKLEEYMKQDNEWKVLVQPNINSVANLKTFGKFGFALLTVGSVIVAMITGIISIFKNGKL